ncbi:hypothetical protein Q1695_010698 [Nippostrongylus brasiliensis]|nr:hypothetical protein Q1695_010698 [Nippostrongylus brasiliensis]
MKAGNPATDQFGSPLFTGEIEYGSGRNKRTHEKAVRHCTKSDEQRTKFFSPFERKVAKIRKLHGDNMKKFALDLEKILYECQQEELKKTAEKRVDTVDKVDFIKKCLFMFYEIPEMARRTTWTAVRNSLDSRARRRRNYNIHPTARDLAHLDNDDIKSLRLEIHSTKRAKPNKQFLKKIF